MFLSNREMNPAGAQSGSAHCYMALPIKFTLIFPIQSAMPSTPFIPAPLLLGPPVFSSTCSRHSSGNSSSHRRSKNDAHRCQSRILVRQAQRLLEEATLIGLSRRWVANSFHEGYYCEAFATGDCHTEIMYTLG